MFKAHQKLMVLQELTEKDRSGYELIKHIGDVTSSKPSPGYIYPLLHELKLKGLASSSAKGRKTIYSITAKGEKFLAEMKESQARMTGEMRKSIEALGGKKEVKKFLKLSAEMVEHRNELMKEDDLIRNLLESIIHLYHQKDFKAKRQQLRQILKESAEKIKRLAEN